jgi:hypothetical protein
LRHFLTGPYTCRSASYATQVNIVGRIHQGFSFISRFFVKYNYLGEIRRICVVNKPVLVSQISPPEISRHIVKWAVKKRLLHGSEPSGSKNAADNFLNALPTIEEKKRYSIVNIDASGGDKYRVLVRSTPHGEIWQGDKLGNKSISFTVKPEFLPEFGAEVFTIFRLLNYFFIFRRCILKSIFRDI